jgi:hypothetical protein
MMNQECCISQTIFSGSGFSECVESGSDLKFSLDSDPNPQNGYTVYLNSKIFIKFNQKMTVLSY